VKARPTRVLSLPAGIVVRVHARSVAVSAILLVFCGVLSIVALTTGAYHVSPAGVLAALTGGGAETDRFIVLRQRLPRAAAALLVGAALGLAGAIFQSLSRNSLGSPDIIGFTTGSASGALISLLVANSSGVFVGIGALSGGLVTALSVYALSAVRGGGERLIMAGIAVGAMLSSINDYLITTADPENAEIAKLWLFGSLNVVSWPQVVPLACALPPLALATSATGKPLRLMEMGEDQAAALGIRTARVRGYALCLGVALTGLAITTAGPIGFLALAAPQLARRLSRSNGVAPMVAMVMGAALLSAADLLGQRVLAPFQIPVGLVTGALGGAYLVWLLALEKSST
jgi:iron complex transport system permease protein